MACCAHVNNSSRASTYLIVAQYSAGMFVTFVNKIARDKTEYKTERVTSTLEPNFAFEKILTIPKARCVHACNPCLAFY